MRLTLLADLTPATLAEEVGLQRDGRQTGQTDIRVLEAVADGFDPTVDLLLHIFPSRIVSQGGNPGQRPLGLEGVIGSRAPELRRRP